MSYLSSEQSVAAGQPVELYHLADDMGTNCRITSAGYDITYGSYLYTSEPCQRSELRITDSHEKNNMTLKLSRDNAWAARFFSAPIEGIATLTIYRGHGTDFVTWWYGVFTAPKFDNDGVPTLIATPRTSSISRVGRRRRCQKLCDHALGDSGCKINLESYKVSGTVDSVTGLIVSATELGGQAVNYFRAGKFVWGYARRMITASTGETVTLSRAIPGLVAGASFNAYAGCDHTPAICLSTFANKINFGGEEFLPTKNPFTGDAIL